MILGLFWIALANGAALLGAARIGERLRTGERALDALIVLLVRLLLISGAVLGSGVLGMLTPAGLGLPAGILLVLLIVLGSRRRLFELRLPDLGLPITVLGVAVGVRLLAQVWLFPPHLGDALAYHLPKIAEWIQAGRFTREMGVHTHVTFPAGFELVETWWVVFLHHDVLIEMAGVEFLIVGFVAVVALARTLGAQGRAAYFAAFIFILAPGYHFGATSCINDTPASTLVVAAMSLAAARTHPALLAAVIGLGLGVKPTFGFCLPGIVYLTWRVRQNDRPAPLPSVKTAVALGLSGLAIGSYWYLRNWSWFGNPFYPLGSPGFVDPTPVQFGPRLDSLPTNLSELLGRRIYDSATLYGANADYMTCWGAAAFSSGAVALVATMREDQAMRRVGSAFLISLFSMLALVQNDPWCLKYTSYFPAILAVAIARLIGRIPEIGVIAGAGLAFSFLGTFFSYDLRPEHAQILSRMSWRERSAASLTFQDLSKDVPDPVVGYFGGPTGSSYLLYRPDFSRRVHYFRVSTVQALAQESKEAGVRYVFAPKPTPEQAALIAEALKAGTLEKLEGRCFRLR